MSDEILLRLNRRKSYESGEPSIDEEHKELFRLASVLINTAMEQDDHPDRFAQAFQALLAHAIKHFAGEEQILAAYEYEDLEEHVRLHRELVLRANKLYQAITTRQLSVGQLIDFIIDDLVKGHMLKKDRKLYHLFRKVP